MAVSSVLPPGSRFRKIRACRHQENIDSGGAERDRTQQRGSRSPFRSRTSNAAFGIRVLAFGAVNALARIGVSRRTLVALTGTIGVVALAFGCRGGPTNVLVEFQEARALAANVRVQFNKADDASNRAVMADTDEASIAFAKDARKATQIVERDAAALAPLLESLRFPDELRSFHEFRTRFGEYKKLDGEILALAVENTNLKAQRLAFGPARAAADELKSSLQGIAASLAPRDRCRADELIARVLLAVREIQVLEAPHIASPSDGEMTRLEQEMAALDRTAREAVNALSELAPPDARKQLDPALASLDKFKGVTSQIIALSRRNTNVRSFDLALREKPALVSACDDSLDALQEALSREGSKATR